jgi:hypothetical protein
MSRSASMRHAEGLVHDHAVIFRPLLRQHRIASFARPVEGAAVHDQPAHGIAVAAEELGQRMHHDVGAVVDRPAQIGGGERVVDDERNSGALRHRGNRRDVGDDAARIGDRLDEDRLGLGRDGALESPDVVRIGPHHVPAEVLEGVIELVDRAAVELLGRDELLARLHQAVHHDDLRGMTGGDREPGGAALERRHPLLQHRRRRIADAGIDVAEGLQAEQRGRMVDILEHERGGLIDRRRARTGRGIGLGAGMNCQGREAGDALGHGWVLVIDEPLVADRNGGAWKPCGRQGAGHGDSRERGPPRGRAGRSQRCESGNRLSAADCR